MTIREELNTVTIAELQKHNNLFIMIIGGSASGKNHIYDKYFSHLPLIDVDEYVSTNQLTVSEAIRQSEEDFFKIIGKEISLVSVGCGSSTAGVEKKLYFAKYVGMKTCIIRVDTPPDVAQKRNILRSLTENRDEIPQHKIVRTNKLAKLNFHEFAKTTDYALIIKN